jgi:hypothetical protein
MEFSYNFILFIMNFCNNQLIHDKIIIDFRSIAALQQYWQHTLVEFQHESQAMRHVSHQI